jgi:hypothetical protein
MKVKQIRRMNNQQQVSPNQYHSLQPPSVTNVHQNGQLFEESDNNDDL